MKDKVFVEAMKEVIETSLETLSLHITGKGAKVAFFLHENPAIPETVDGKKTTSYGFLVEAQTPGNTKKLFFRKYDLANTTLNAAKRAAYTEFLNVTLGTFLVTAQNASPEILQKLSISQD